MTKSSSYVLVTPARNEEAFIGETIRSVIAQTCQPSEWIIVSDGSTDRTDEIAGSYAAMHPWIRLLRLNASPSRSFASVVFAIESGLRAIQTPDYDFIGILDADVRFSCNYFEKLIERFRLFPRLGLAGGVVLDVIKGTVPWQRLCLKDVAGAVQLFSRSCFESLGGLIPIPEGGWDAITNIRARANGYDTRTFPELRVEHLKPRNSMEGGSIQRKWQLGIRDYALGYHPAFELAKCVVRWRERPVVVGGLARIAGFGWSTIHRLPRILPPDVIAAIRREQRNRMLFRTTMPNNT